MRAVLESRLWYTCGTIALHNILHVCSIVCGFNSPLFFHPRNPRRVHAIHCSHRALLARPCGMEIFIRIFIRGPCRGHQSGHLHCAGAPLLLRYRSNLLGANVGWHSSNLYYSFYSIFYFFLPRLGKQHEQVISAHFLCCASWMGVVSSDQCSISEGWSHWANQRRHEIHIGELDFESFTEHRRGTSCHHEGAIITFSLVPIDS